MEEMLFKNHYLPSLFIATLRFKFPELEDTASEDISSGLPAKPDGHYLLQSHFKYTNKVVLNYTM